MKALITIVILTFMSMASIAAFTEGRVIYDACSENSVQAKNNWQQFARITSVCKVTVLGMDFTTPIYSVEYVSKMNEYTTYLYSQVSYKATPAKDKARLKAATIGLQILGTVENGLINRIYFIKKPAVEKISAFNERRRNTIVAISGKLKLLGSGTESYSISINNFETINSSF